MAISNFFKRWVPASEDGQNTNAGSHRKIQVAVCALMVEMARIDKVFTQDELGVLATALAQRFQLSRTEIQQLITDAESELNNSLDLWQFAKTINDHLSNDEKIELVESLWRVVLVDGRLDEHEHYLMSKLRNLLRLDQQQINAAKSKALATGDEPPANG